MAEALSSEALKAASLKIDIINNILFLAVGFFISQSFNSMWENIITFYSSGDIIFSSAITLSTVIVAIASAYFSNEKYFKSILLIIFIILLTLITFPRPDLLSLDLGNFSTIFNMSGYILFFISAWIGLVFLTLMNQILKKFLIR
jgi:hypothetical protein